MSFRHIVKKKKASDFKKSNKLNIKYLLNKKYIFKGLENALFIFIFQCAFDKENQSSGWLSAWSHLAKKR